MPPYFVSQNASGLYEVVGPGGAIRGTYLKKDDADALADSLNASVQGAHSNPMAFGVFDLGGGGGFGVFDASGNPTTRFFKTRAEAQNYADDLKAAFLQTVQQMTSGAKPPTSTNPPPLPTPPRGSGSNSTPFPAPPSPPPPAPSQPGQAGFIGPLPSSFYATPPAPIPPNPGQKGFIGPLPSSFYATPPAPAAPQPGQPGFVGPLPASFSQQPPTPWIPSPGQKGFVGPLPQSFYPQPPTPWVPSPGQPGFIGPMPQPAQPPVPSPVAPGHYGFIGPLPQSSKDLMDALRKALDAATAGMPHANGNKFNWGKIAQGISSGLGAVGGSSPTSGLPQSVINWAGVGASIAKGFDRAIGTIGGLATVSEGLGRFAENVNESNRRLAPFNGRIASAFMQLDMGDFRRDFRMAAATSETGVRLAQTINAKRDAWLSVEILGAGINNRLGIIGGEISRINGNALSMGAEVLGAAMEAIDPAGKTSSWAGRLLGIGQKGLEGFMLGKMFGPWGGLAGGLGGLALGVAADLREAPAGAMDPWGDFLIASRVLPVLRPVRVVVP